MASCEKIRKSSLPGENKMFNKFLAISFSLLFLSGCVTTPEQAGQVGAGALSGALIGSLAGAAISPKGGGRRGDGAVRGAMGGAALGALAGIYGSQRQGSGYSYDSYGGGSGSIPDHCRVYSDYRSQNICAQEAYRELASQQARARRAADQEARERGRSWRY